MFIEFVKRQLRTFMILSLCVWAGIIVSAVSSQAKPLCYKSSFNGGAGVSFIDQACLARRGRLKKIKKRQRFAAVALKKKKKTRKVRNKRIRGRNVKIQARKAQNRKKLKRKRSKRVLSQRRKSQRRQRKNIILLQKLLAERQHEIGKPNGLMGRKTKQAMARYAQQFKIKRETSVHAVLKHLLARKIQPIPLPLPAPTLSQKPSIAVASFTSKPFKPNVERGEKYARQCLGCHSFTAKEGHKAGPNLHGVMGQFIGSATQFNYSDSFKFQMTMGNTWSRQELDCFLKDPQGCKPGTSMSFNGIKSANKRADLIAYLAQLGQ